MQAKEKCSADSSRTIPGKVLNSPIDCRTQIVGTIAGGIINPIRTIEFRKLEPFPCLLCKTKAAIEHTRIMVIIDKTVIRELLKKALRTIPWLAVTTC